jgi:hypothetical protein
MGDVTISVAIVLPVAQVREVVRALRRVDASAPDDIHVWAGVDAPSMNHQEVREAFEPVGLRVEMAMREHAERADQRLPVIELTRGEAAGLVALMRRIGSAARDHQRHEQGGGRAHRTDRPRLRPHLRAYSMNRFTAVTGDEPGSAFRLARETRARLRRGRVPLSLLSQTRRAQRSRSRARTSPPARVPRQSSPHREVTR